MSELVELDSNDSLLTESSFDGKGSEEIKKMLQGEPVAEEVSEEVSEEVESQPEEQVQVEEQPERQEEVQPAPEPDKDSIYRQAVQDVLGQLKGQFNQNQQAPESKKQSNPEETLEKFTQDPEGFLAQLIEQKISPHRQEISKIEENTIRATARRNNSDFAKLEPVVDKIQEMHPSLVSGKNVAETLEVYYLIAKGLEAQENEKKSQSSKDKETQSRQASKRSASMLPKGTRKTVSSGNEKPFHALSSDDMRKRIAEMTGSRSS